MEGKVKKRLFTIEEASFYLGRTVHAVRKLIYRGELPFIKNGKRIHLDIQDMEAFVNNNKKRFIEKDLISL